MNKFVIMLLDVVMAPVVIPSALVMWVIGLLWMRKIINIEV